MHMTLFIGLAAGFFTAFAFVPQAIKTIKTGNTEGLSLLMYFLFLIGVVLWIIYGFSTHDMAVLVANLVVFVFAFPVLLITMKNFIKKRKNRGP